MAISDADQGRQTLPRPLWDGRSRRPEVEAEITALLAYDPGALRARLRQAVTERDLHEESLVYFARDSCEDDRDTFLLACEALYMKIKPVLLAHARRLRQQEREDHVQDVLLTLSTHLVQQNPTLDYAERFFASYLKRRSIDVLRTRPRDSARHTEPIGKRVDPGDSLVGDENSASALDRLVHLEDLQKEWRKLERLRPEVRKAFINRRVLGLSVDETVKLAPSKVTNRTINNWVALAEKALSEPDGTQP
jgi:DNA-directed RNA polymerase specialized sigma24 family protein